MQYDNFPPLVRNGAGRMIRDRRAIARRPARRRLAESGTAVVTEITLALLDEPTTHAPSASGFDPYDAQQGHSRPDVWGSKRRD